MVIPSTRDCHYGQTTVDHLNVKSHERLSCGSVLLESFSHSWVWKNELVSPPTALARERGQRGKEQGCSPIHSEICLIAQRLFKVKNIFMNENSNAHRPRGCAFSLVRGGIRRYDQEMNAVVDRRSADGPPADAVHAKAARPQYVKYRKWRNTRTATITLRGIEATSRDERPRGTDTSARNGCTRDSPASRHKASTAPTPSGPRRRRPRPRPPADCVGEPRLPPKAGRRLRGPREIQNGTKGYMACIVKATDELSCDIHDTVAALQWQDVSVASAPEHVTHLRDRYTKSSSNVCFLITNLYPR
ncbi:hypothetical protein EVAR_19614_1 [Eumeta japonica]|uniref:Uncharacterized protein n=1 Tax=Eumeta variegata TaxID=151549 RepID=A0A4C1UGM1_EUMVA|nr:hypothetical protein EVAR_19614_1 [Eumeta japonica]